MRGNFKIDSALQLQAKSSMMEPEGGVTFVGAHDHGTGVAPVPSAPVQAVAPDEFKRQLGAIWSAYRRMAGALAADDFKGASGEVDGFRKALSGVDMKLLSDEVHMVWMKELDNLDVPLKAMAEATEIEGMRKQFALLSEALARAIRDFGVSPSATVYRLHCPMAFQGRGADWLQNSPKPVTNPYFGKAMPECGEVVETIPSSKPNGGDTHE